MKKSLLIHFVGMIFLIYLQSATATEIIVSNSTELQNAINNVQGGDTISLLSGNYGTLTINGKNNTSFVTIRAYPGFSSAFFSCEFS
ncbi:MAG: hypothetical protein HND40_09115 [Ignavibacteriota bacterium]|nr:MAG: hypothetical protein HND40_09115 [Ignavibacteriota bacterium]